MSKEADAKRPNSSPEAIAALVTDLQQKAARRADDARVGFGFDLAPARTLEGSAAALLELVAAKCERLSASNEELCQNYNTLLTWEGQQSERAESASRQLAEARAALTEMGEAASAIRDWLARGGWPEDFSNWPDGMAAHHSSRIDGLSLADRINALVARALLSGEPTK